MKKEYGNNTTFQDILLIGSLALLCALITLLSKPAKSSIDYTQNVAPKEEGTPLPDTLNIITLSGSTTYFTIQEEEMGYEYELAKLFAESHQLPFKVTVAPNIEDLLKAVANGDADICITPQPITQSGKTRFLFAGPESQSGLVLVQESNRKDKKISNVTELLGKKITVPAGSRYAERIKHLSEQLGGEINITEAQGDTINTEELMNEVSLGNIDYTLADEETAKLIKTYYNNLDISIEVGFKQRLRWVVNKGSDKLAELLDKWAENLSLDKDYKMIYKKYFELNKSNGNISGSKATIDHKREKIILLSNGAISPFDNLFKSESKRLGWPWQILASIAYHESRFTSDIIGWSGARGLMGIMPNTGRRFGVTKDQLLDPRISIKISVDCLLAFGKSFREIDDSIQRIKLTLASYNAGLAHIQDAQRLAKKYGHNPTVWDNNVEICLKLKSDPKYYNDPVCKYGYLRGKETIGYVTNVVGRADNYMAKTR